jgi:polysaccharide deacetylase 2 family uncharacterized protein YibQ
VIRDFVAGVLWGSVVSVAGLGVISQVAAPPHGVAVPAAAPAEPAGESPAVTGPQPATPGPAEAGMAETAATPDAPPSGDAALQPPAAAEGAAPPAVAAQSPEAAGMTADAGPGAPAPAPEAKAPALPAADAAPEAPPADAAPGPVVQAPAPGTVMPEAPAGLPQTGGPAPAPAPGAELPPPLPGQPADRLLEPGAPESPAPLPGMVSPAPQPLPEPAAEPAPLPVPEPLPEADGTGAAPAPEGPKLIEPDSAVQLPPARALPKDAEGVTIGRLPSIGAPGAGAEPPAAAEPAPEDLPPIRRYAAAFDNPTGKPLFALILTDDGSPELDRARLAALPFPVTFVIDPLAANAADAAATYRAGGKEVVMLATGIPAGATAADLEQSFQAVSAALPEAVAVADLPKGGFQDDRPLAAQVVTILKAEGRGLITYDRGLNAADQVARREDLPAATIFRELDAQGEDIPLIRRYLDRAAFKAAQEGRVAVIGTASPGTVAAVMEWTIEGRASSVTLAPATAVMVVQ